MKKEVSGMTYLVVAAHPDDEVLGAGATLAKLASEGNTVITCFLSGEVTARRHRPELEKLRKDIISSARILGVKQVILGKFPNIQFNTIPHLSMVQFIEQVILDTEAETIFTHHPSDLNNDHLHTSLACQAAIRLFQRRDGVLPVKELLFMEIPSSTEWSLNKSVQPFTPNVYIETREEFLTAKLQALAEYSGVMRDYPHPRSQIAIKGLAAYRGAQAGMVYAESFESVFRREL
jgi:LmbE family N-acetylglucosaminyl deacetylase